MSELEWPRRPMCVRLSAFLSLPEPVAPSAAGSVEAGRSQGGPLSSASSGPAWPGGLPLLHQNLAGHTLRSGPPVKGDFSYILTIYYTSQHNCNTRPVRK